MVLLFVTEGLLDSLENLGKKGGFIKRIFIITPVFFDIVKVFVK